LTLALGTPSWTGPVIAADKIELSFWHAKAGHRGKVWGKMVEEFNKAHPGIQVTATYQGGYTVTLQKITTAIAADATPDVSEIPNRYGIPQFAESGKLIALNQFMSKAEIEDWFLGARMRATYKKKLYAIPNAISTPLLFYNANMFKEVGLDPDKPPQTWDELVTYAKKLTRDIDGDGKIDKWGLGMHTTLNYFLYAFILQNGGELLDEEGNPLFNTPEAAEACRFWSDLVHKHKVMPPLTHNATNKLFIAGTTAMMYQSDGFIAKLGESIGNRFEVRVAFLPKKKRYAVGLGGSNLGIFKSNPKREAAAWEFVKWVTSPEMSAYWAENTGYIAPRKSAQALASHKAFLKANPMYGLAAEQMQYAADMPATKSDSLIYKSFASLAQKLEADAGVDIEKALADMEKMVQSKIK